MSVEIHIDETVFSYDMPLLNGSLVVYEDTLNQLRINNGAGQSLCQRRGRCRTGSGLYLWAAGDGDDGEEDLSRHSTTP